MRRNLVVVRHAKSAWDDPTLDDHERPLARRGRDALPKLAAHLDRAPAPDVVLCSSAVRTKATLDGIRSILPTTADVVIDERLYHASVHWWLAQVRALDDGVRTAVLIGHNPGLHQLVALLVGDGDPARLALLRAKFPTAAAATFSFDGDWGDVGAGSGRLDELFLPREADPLP